MSNLSIHAIKWKNATFKSIQFIQSVNITDNYYRQTV